MPHHNSHYYEFGPYRLDRNGQKRAEAFLNAQLLSLNTSDLRADPLKLKRNWRVVITGRACLTLHERLSLPRVEETIAEIERMMDKDTSNN